jgi:hypothetical protein
VTTFDLIAMVAGYACCLGVGFLAGRNALKASIEKRVKKEIYEQGKLDGAFEFVRDTIFTSITKR